MSAQGSSRFIKLIVSWFLPPLGVFMAVGFGVSFWISLALSLAYFPGVIHAVWVICTDGRNPAPEEGRRDFWRIVAAYFFPPLGVYMQSGITGAFWLNLLLTLFFYVPGVLHATWVIVNED